VCGRAASDTSLNFRASSLATLAAMVAGGAGVTLLPVTATRLAEQWRLALVPLRAPAAHRTICFAYRPAASRAGDYEELAELFVEHAPPGVRAS
jgi:LysR family hydrogen peroxide-inducible transcriptional activator